MCNVFLSLSLQQQQSSLHQLQVFPENKAGKSPPLPALIAKGCLSCFLPTNSPVTFSQTQDDTNHHALSLDPNPAPESGRVYSQGISPSF